MIVTINTSSTRGETAQFLVSITFPKGANSAIVKATVAEYLLLFQGKFKLGNVTKKKVGSHQFLLLCSIKNMENKENPMTDSALLSYFFSLGFVTLKTIQDVEEMEKIQIVIIFEEVSRNYATLLRISHFKSRKVFAKKRVIVCLHNKLHFVRDALEELTYSDTKYGETCFEAIQEIDFLIDHLEEFTSDFKLAYLINKSVKDKLIHYSEFYDNVRSCKEMLD